MELYNKIKDLEDFLDKEELNNIVEIREYKKLENKVNYMILSINNLLKEIVKEEK